MTAIKKYNPYVNNGGSREGSGRKRTSIDERRAVALYKEGFSKRKIAERFDVPYYVILYFFKHFYDGK